MTNTVGINIKYMGVWPWRHHGCQSEEENKKNIFMKLESATQEKGYKLTWYRRHHGCLSEEGNEKNVYIKLEINTRKGGGGVWKLTWYKNKIRKIY